MAVSVGNRLLSIVIPAFNEERRLPETLKDLGLRLKTEEFRPFVLHEVLIVDDGSRDRTIEVAESFRDALPMLRVLPTPVNRGKGHAVRTGLKAATGDWALIADADMSTPWRELLVLGEALDRSKAEIAIASRDLPESNVTRHQSWIRENMGKTFNLIVRGITRLPYRDTQCGFKLVHLVAARPLLNELQVDRFAWDVEFLMAAVHHGLPIVEVPVEWSHKEESRVHPVRDAMDMALTVTGLRLRYIWRSRKDSNLRPTA